MKVLSVMVMAVLCLGVLGCEDHDKDRTNTVYVDVPDPIIINTNIITPPNGNDPGGLTIVEVVDPNGLLTDPNSGVTQDLLNKELDYQVLYVWYQREKNESVDFNTFLKGARFHIVVDTAFKVNKDRNVHYAVLPSGFDIYVAALRRSADGHYFADADSAMDLLSGDVNEGGDRHAGTDFQLAAYPAYPTSGYYVIH